MGRLLATGPAAVVVVVAAAFVAGAASGGLTDLHVYRHGGRSVLDGVSVYAARDPVEGLPFTYPPFAAVVFVPVALLPGWLAAGLWTAASVAALVGVVGLGLRELGRPAPAWLLAPLALVAVALEPVWQNLAFGQVNLLLMLAVLVDLLAPGRRWSGVLLGVVVGIKLTPLVFVVLLVLVGHRAAAGRALLTFAVTVVVGWIPGGAAYWTDRLVDPSRVGPPALAHNQSVHGALTRLLDGTPSTLLWVLVAGPLAALALALGAVSWRRGQRLLGVGGAALAMLLASPVSWSHHWVWAVPIALALGERTRAAAAGWTAVFVARPVVWPPYGDGRELDWTPLQHLVGNAYLLAAVAVVGAGAVALGSRAGRTSPGTRSAHRGRIPAWARGTTSSCATSPGSGGSATASTATTPNRSTSRRSPAAPTCPPGTSAASSASPSASRPTPT